MTKIIFDNTYTWVGCFGSWFKSQENIKVGTVRFIRGRLFHVYSVYHDTFLGFGTHTASWCPVDSNYSMEEIRSFKDAL